MSCGSEGGGLLLVFGQGGQGEGGDVRGGGEEGQQGGGGRGGGKEGGGGGQGGQEGSCSGRPQRLLHRAGGRIGLY